MHGPVQLEYATPARRTRIRPRWGALVILGCVGVIALAGLMQARAARPRLRFAPSRQVRVYPNVRFIPVGPVLLEYGSFGGGVVDAARGTPLGNTGVVITVTVRRPPVSRTPAGR